MGLSTCQASRAVMLRRTLAAKAQPKPKGNDDNSNRHLVQHLCGACVIALLFVAVEKVV